MASDRQIRSLEDFVTEVARNKGHNQAGKADRAVVPLRQNPLAIGSVIRPQHVISEGACFWYYAEVYKSDIMWSETTNLRSSPIPHSPSSGKLNLLASYFFSLSSLFGRLSYPIRAAAAAAASWLLPPRPLWTHSDGQFVIKSTSTWRRREKWGEAEETSRKTIKWWRTPWNNIRFEDFAFFHFHSPPSTD